MKNRMFIILLIMGFLSFLRLNAADASTQKLAELAKLPFGLKVVHTPDKVRAVRGKPSGFTYTWVYKTSVTATNDSVVVQEFGAFAWLNGKWVLGNFTGKPFTSKDFEDWYSCPAARAVRGTGSQ